MKIKSLLFWLIMFAVPFYGFSADHFTENFDSGPADYFTGQHTFASGLTWDVVSIKGETAANSYGGFGSAARFLANVEASIVSPSVNTLGSITFQYRELNAIGGGSFTVQKSVSGGAFTDIETVAFSGTSYQTYSVVVSEASADVRIRVIGTNATYLIVDELTLTTLSFDPQINTSVATLPGFSYYENYGPSAEQSYTISGMNLDGTDVIIAPPSFYQISFTSGSGFITNPMTLTLPAYDGTETTIYVRLISGLFTGDYSTNQLITHTGGGATQIDVACSGTVDAVPAPFFDITPLSLTGFTYIDGNGPSSEQSYTITGNFLDGSDVLITPPADYEVSLTSGSGFVQNPSSITLSAFDGTTTTIFVRLAAGLAVNTYNNELIVNSGGGATTINVDCSGEVVAVTPPTLESTTLSLTGLNYYENAGPSAEQEFTLSGINLDGNDVIITPPVNFEVSLTSGSGFVQNPATITLPAFDGTATLVYVRLIQGLAIGTYISETISISGGGASTINIDCSGEVSTAPAGGCASDLFISEYHEPTSGNNKGVEIYNGTGAPVDLTAYAIGIVVNGGTDVENTIQLSGTLNDGETACIYNDADLDANFRLMGNLNFTWTSATWNGDDAIYLLKDGLTMANIIDAIGDLPPMVDPGAEFINNGVSTLNTALVRKSSVQGPTTIWNGLEWTIYTAGTYTDWGMHTLNCGVVEPAPVIDSVLFSTGSYGIGDTIFVTIYTDGTGYTDLILTINGQPGIGFTDNNDGTYTVYYIVQEGDPSVMDAADIAISIVLDNNGSSNGAFTTPTSGATSIDAVYPEITGATRFDNTTIVVSLTEFMTNSGINDGGFTVYETGVPANTFAVSLVSLSIMNPEVNLTCADFSSAASSGLTVYYTMGGNGTLTDYAENALQNSIEFVIAPWGGPVISAVAVADGDYIIGDTVDLTIYADAIGMFEDTISFNGKPVVNFVDNSDNTYSCSYVVEEGDPTALSINDVALVMILNDGTYTVEFTGLPSGTITIDAIRPVIQSITRTTDTTLLVVFSEAMNIASVTQSGANGFTVSDIDQVNYFNVLSTETGTIATEVILNTEDMSSASEIGLYVDYSAAGGVITDAPGNALFDSGLIEVYPWVYSGASDILISEYIEGSSFNKAIEIYNGTGIPVDLSHYSLEKDVNGNGIFGNTYTYTGILPNGGVYLITRADANAAIVALADDVTTSSVVNFNGDDQVRLLKDGVEIDRIGISGAIQFAANVTYVRRPEVCSPTPGEQDPASNGQWIGYPSDTFDYLGFHVADCQGVGIEEAVTVNDNMVIYPNPASSQINIVHKISSGNITISDITGATVRSQVISGEMESAIDISGIDAGMYIISVTDGTSTKTSRFIKY